ncbi:hypothetical protein B5M44_22945 [Shinella sumterensis]|nr:hypothetical protein B5M44_22945 [Shinella sumterensis]
MTKERARLWSGPMEVSGGFILLSPMLRISAEQERASSVGIDTLCDPFGGGKIFRTRQALEAKKRSGTVFG